MGLTTLHILFIWFSYNSMNFHKTNQCHLAQPHDSRGEISHATRTRGPWRLPAETALEKSWMESLDVFEFGTLLVFSCAIHAYICYNHGYLYLRIIHTYFIIFLHSNPATTGRPVSRSHPATFALLVQVKTVRSSQLAGPSKGLRISRHF